MGSVDRRFFMIGTGSAMALPLVGCGGGSDDDLNLPSVSRLRSPATQAADGRQYQSLPDEHALLITAPNGSTRRVGGLGQGPGKLNYPVDVVVVEGLAYVVEVGNHRVQIFDANGNSVDIIGEDFLLYPGGINAMGHEILVADSRNARVVAMTRDGRLIRTYGEGILSAPRGVVAVKDGILVADPGLRKVLKLGFDGKQIGEFGSNWVLPWDLATDGELIFVVDHSRPEVSVVDSSGSHVYGISQPSAARFVSYENGKLFVA